MVLGDVVRDKLFGEVDKRIDAADTFEVQMIQRAGNKVGDLSKEEEKR